ncbi:MAG: hypothetical protein V5A27_08535 [Halapricum sp.]
MVSDEYTRIPVYPDTRARLRRIKATEGESYDSLLKKMADQYDPPRAAAGGVD